MLKIKSVEYVISVGRIDQLPNNGYPEIAFAGRSNVGKSSLLNTIFARKKMALVSSTPGKTRTLNFFNVNNKYHFVDLPGYGFAKVSKQESRKWRQLIEGYFQSSSNLCGIVVLVDMRHAISPLDLDLLDWLRSNSIPLLVVGTKADKLSGNKLAVQEKILNKSLSELGISKLVPFSTVSGKGKMELLKLVHRLLDDAK
jgi:GTP-binding protein